MTTSLISQIIESKEIFAKKMTYSVVLLHIANIELRNLNVIYCKSNLFFLLKSLQIPSMNSFETLFLK